MSEPWKLFCDWCGKREPYLYFPMIRLELCCECDDMTATFDAPLA